MLTRFLDQKRLGRAQSQIRTHISRDIVKNIALGIWFSMTKHQQDIVLRLI